MFPLPASALIEELLGLPADAVQALGDGAVVAVSHDLRDLNELRATEEWAWPGTGITQ